MVPIFLPRSLSCQEERSYSENGRVGFIANGLAADDMVDAPNGISMGRVRIIVFLF